MDDACVVPGGFAVEGLGLGKLFSMLCMEPKLSLSIYKLPTANGLVDGLFRDHCANSAHLDSPAVFEKGYSFEHGNGLATVLL